MVKAKTKGLARQRVTRRRLIGIGNCRRGTIRSDEA